MYVNYYGKCWLLDSPIRATLFDSLKESDPTRMVTIKKDEVTKKVEIRELENWSVYRNTNFTKRR